MFDYPGFLTLARPRYDKAFVVGFDVTPEVTQNFTDNTEALSRGVRALRPGGGTAMYDALYFACRDKLLKEPRNDGPVRRAIILLSDGARAAKLEVIEGQPPIMKAQPTACAFRARCTFAMERCGRENPQRQSIAPGHDVACFWDFNTGKERHV